MNNKLHTNFIRTIKVILIIILILIILAIIKIIIFRQNVVTNITVENNQINYYEKIERMKNIFLYDGIKKEEQNLGVGIIDKIGVYFNGSKLNIENNLLEKNLRIYVPLIEFCKNLNVQVQEDDKFITLNYKSNISKIDKKESNIVIGDAKKNLRGEFLVKDEIEYLSLSDLVFILNLRDEWDKDTKKIFLSEKEDNRVIESSKTNTVSKVALIRLEDITAGEVLIEGDNVLKMKILGEYLEHKGVKFNVAWIPRYKNPSEGIDNDLLTNKTFANMEFISLLDSWIFNGAKIGLHGYTHQYKDSVSVKGVELSWRYNDDEDRTRRVVEEGIHCANVLNIPIDFFESPHYRATRKQQKVFEEYFKIIYEPYRGYWNLNPLISFNNKETLYVPAPVRIETAKNAKEAISIIDRMSKNKYILMSFFYHPSAEYDNIQIVKNDNGRFVGYKIDGKSILVNIVDELNKNNYVTITVDQLIEK